MLNNIQSILNGVQGMFGQTTQNQNPTIDANEEKAFNYFKDILDKAVTNDKRMFELLKNMHDALGLNEQIRGRVQLLLGKAYNELSEKHKNYKSTK